MDKYTIIFGLYFIFMAWLIGYFLIYKEYIYPKTKKGEKEAEEELEDYMRKLTEEVEEEKRFKERGGIIVRIDPR